MRENPTSPGIDLGLEGIEPGLESEAGSPRAVLILSLMALSGAAGTGVTVGLIRDVLP